MLGTGHVGIHNGLDLTAVPQGIVALQIQLPVAVIQTGQGMGGLVPVIEFTFQVQLIGRRCPFTVIPAAVNMMEAVVIVGIGKIIQCLALAENTAFGGPIQEHTQIDVTGKALQLRVQF